MPGRSDEGCVHVRPGGRQVRRLSEGESGEVVHPPRLSPQPPRLLLLLLFIIIIIINIIPHHHHHHLLLLLLFLFLLILLLLLNFCSSFSISLFASDCLLIAVPVKQSLLADIQGQLAQVCDRKKDALQASSSLPWSLLTLPVSSLQEVKSALEIEKVELETPAVAITLTV
eukprot:746215-Hanusia_phi.AAC.2